MYYSHLVYTIGYTENFALSQNGTDQEKFTQLSSKKTRTFSFVEGFIFRFMHSAPQHSKDLLFFFCRALSKCVSNNCTSCFFFIWHSHMPHSGISFNIKLSNTHVIDIHTIKYDARLRNALIQILG